MNVFVLLKLDCFANDNRGLHSSSEINDLMIQTVSILHQVLMFGIFRTCMMDNAEAVLGGLCLSKGVLQYPQPFILACKQTLLS